MNRRLIEIQEGIHGGCEIRDIDRVVKAFSNLGYEVDRLAAYIAWDRHSTDECASWLILDHETDDSIVEKCLPYLKEYGTPESAHKIMRRWKNTETNVRTECSCGFVIDYPMNPWNQPWSEQWSCSELDDAFAKHATKMEQP